MIRVVIGSNGLEDDSVVMVPRSILRHSDVASDKATASGYFDCEEIVFSPDENITKQEFTHFVHFLYTGTIETNGPLSPHSVPNDAEVSDRVTNWVNGFRVGHHLQAEQLMNHCIGVAMNLHLERPVGLGLTVGSEVLYHILPLLKQPKHEDLYELLAKCIAREWKDAVLGEKEDRIAEWNHTFRDWPEFASKAKSVCRRG